MITRFQARGYKSLAEVDVALARLTVVFGPNAAGKSNLLDALGLLGRLVTEDNLDDAFKAHRGAPLEAFTLPPGGTEALQRQPSARLRLSVDVRLSDSVVTAVQSEIEKRRAGLDAGKPQRRVVLERYLRYSVEVEIRTDSGHLLVMDERLEALNRDGELKRSRAPFLERLAGEDFIRLRHEGQGRPAQEEIGQDRTVVSKRLYAPHYPHVAALREEMASWRFYLLEPALMRQEVPLQEVETLAADGSDLAAFYNSVKARGSAAFHGYELALRQVVRSADGLAVERTPQGTLRLVVHEGEIPLSSRLLSEGSLRVLGLLAITNPLRPLSLVGYEEPENGIHATRLAVVATMLLEAAEAGQTQFVLNTHSPVLPEHFQVQDQTTLLACRMSHGRTSFSHVRGNTLFAGDEIADALDGDETSSLAERLVRGDFA